MIFYLFQNIAKSKDSTDNANANPLNISQNAEYKAE